MFKMQNAIFSCFHKLLSADVHNWKKSYHVSFYGGNCIQKKFEIFILNMDCKGQLKIQGHSIQLLAGLNGVLI